MDTQLMIPQPLAQALLNYLATKPYAEVHQLVGALRSLKQVRVVEEPKDDPSAAV